MILGREEQGGVKMDHIQEFFEYVNYECLNFHIIMPSDDHVYVEWNNIGEASYTTPKCDRINLRFQRTKNKNNNFLDCFQYTAGGGVCWVGFPFVSCTHYEAKTSETDINKLDATFYFGKEHQLCFPNMTTKTMFLLLDFFNDFII